MAFGEKLAYLRKNAKLTQTELGAKLNISAQAISKWENNSSEPDILTIRRLSEIYGISISQILESDSESAKMDGISECQENEDTDRTFDVYLADVGESKIMTIKTLMELLGLDLKDAKEAAESDAFIIQASADEEELRQIKERLEAVGASVSAVASDGKYRRKNINFTPPVPVATKEDNTMKRRFIIANITAGIPAIVFAALILIFAYAKPIDAVLAVWLAIGTYTAIFLAWYPTVTRRLLKPFGLVIDAVNGIFSFIGALLLFPFVLLWTVLVVLTVAPINYIFAIGTRIKRMKDEDEADDIFEDPDFIMSL